MSAITSRSSSGFVASVAAAARTVVRGVGRILTALKNRRQVASLLEADPGMLRDLGLTPMDVHGALAEPLWRDPSARLLIWSVERRAAARAAARDNLLGLASEPDGSGTRPAERCL
ncbi:DUF1127 domain-containing protein [Labrys wisconsinensis]|uniref:Uncharacterized protein YjiS (DUF1127 family) n=1 Tax=Labrys wisconsinensis TaxID=425677 RepID=A0ABU0J819_9HYPH|nr:hypothetical protein [Labrys wisconsinensis]MDQ0470422.1 uncharacterized protein YjiS (DUF1127 family) [Labrys wisconsinensis]